MQRDRSTALIRQARAGVLLAAFAAVVLCATTEGQQPPQGAVPQPRLFSISPMGAKAGTTVEVVFIGPDIEAPQGLLFSHPGIKAELASEPPPPPPDPKDTGKKKAPVASQAVKYKITVPPDVPLGIHDVRIFNQWGVSNPRAFVVGDMNEVVEKEPNNDISDAQRVELNTTINGVIGTPIDVDYSVFAGKKGQRVVISCLSSSIDSRLHPVIELYDAAGKRLATNRDYFHNDAVADATLPADGDYYVRLFQFTHTLGTPEYFYRLTISTAPWIDAVFPPVLEPGKATQVTVYGRNLPGGQPDPTAIVGGSVLEKATVSITAPNDPLAAQRLAYTGYLTPPSAAIDGFDYRIRGPAGASNPAFVGITRSPVVIDNGANVSKEAAQEVKAPCEIAGRFDRKRAQGWYSFSAKKGEVLSIDVLSDRIGSPTDLVMALYNADTKALIVELDDDPELVSPSHFFSRTSDPGRYRFVAAADGKYQLVVKNQGSMGELGPRTFYRVRITPEQPDFRLVVMPTGIAFPEGNIIRQGASTEYAVYALRQDNFNGAIALEVEGLTAGLSCKPQVIGSGQKSGSLVVTAAADAPPWAGELRVKGKAKINGQDVVREARSASVIWPSNAQQNQIIPTFTRLDRGIILAVRDQAPFSLTPGMDSITGQVGDKLMIPLKVERHWADFKGPINVTQGNTPTGKKAPAGQAMPATVIAADKNEAQIAINIPTDEAGTFSVVLRGTAQVPFAKDPMAKMKGNANFTIPSTPVLITILPKTVATVALTPPTAAAKVGTQAEVVVKLTRQFDYEGEFVVELVQPANAKGITCDPVTIPAGKDEAKLVIKVADDAPPGNRADLIVRAVAMIAGKPANHDAKLAVNVTK